MSQLCTSYVDYVALPFIKTACIVNLRLGIFLTRHDYIDYIDQCLCVSMAGACCG